MYAIILTGGKQYRVSEGQTLRVEKLEVKPGEELVFDKVLMVRNGEKVSFGTPTVQNAKVVSDVVGEAKGPKIIIFKKRSKKGYRKTLGHRQHLTEVKIKKIVLE